MKWIIDLFKKEPKTWHVSVWVWDHPLYLDMTDKEYDNYMSQVLPFGQYHLGAYRISK